MPTTTTASPRAAIVVGPRPTPLAVVQADGVARAAADIAVGLLAAYGTPSQLDGQVLIDRFHSAARMYDTAADDAGTPREFVGLCRRRAMWCRNQASRLASAIRTWRAE